MNSNHTPRPIFVVGPTASGKTSLSVYLAEHLGAEIVSADSMQIYQGMTIGTAAPTAEEMHGVPHHMVGVVSPLQPFSASQYREMAQPIVRDILQHGKTPIVVGGTGLYFDALLMAEDYAPMEADLAYRAELNALAVQQGNEAVHALLKACDPSAAARLHPNDLRRVIRALEVFKLTGESIDAQNKKSQQTEKVFDPIWIGICPEDRVQLSMQIDMRVDEMLKKGLLDELRGLLAAGLSADTTAMQAIGYKEFLPVLDGSCRLEDAAEEVKKRSRNYAKRQMTWFKRNLAIRWFTYGSLAAFAELKPSVLTAVQTELSDRRPL